MKHEDYPCCGCGPEGCIDFTRTVTCEDCGKSFHPDGNAEKYCYACGQKPVIKTQELKPITESDADCEYTNCEEKAVNYFYDGNYCRDCIDEMNYEMNEERECEDLDYQS